jgi:hypothetical protein
MKQGTFGNLQSLAMELDRRSRNRNDFIVEPKAAEIFHEEGDNRPHLHFTHQDSNCHTLLSKTVMQDLALQQMMQRLNIPAAYHRKVLSEHPALLRENVNYLLQRHTTPMMFRTRDNQTDAVLSNAYKRIDNYPVASMVLPVLQEADVTVESCDVTDHKMYIKVVSPRLQGDVKVNDPVQLGMVISNSEVGLGFLNVQTMIYRLVCTNGMISGRDLGEGIRMAHRGSRQPLGVAYQEDTIRAIGNSITMQVRDTVRQLLSPENFAKQLEALRETTGRKVTGDPTQAVKELGKVVGFTEDEGSGIMRHLIEGGDLSQYGLLNAVTRYSQDDNINYDRATELERLGGKILELNPRQWKVISEAEAA